MDKNQQELIFRLSMFEQQIRQLQEQIRAIEEGIVELESLNFGLDEISEGEGKELMAPLGRGIFVKTKLISKDLIVDVGGKNFVKKSAEETQEMIKKQVEKLEEVKKELNKGLEEIEKEIRRVIGENEIPTRK